MKKLIFNFKSKEFKKLKEPKNILGGKGANLAEMGRLGLPVPPGFTISTNACSLFYENKRKLNRKLIKFVYQNKPLGTGHAVLKTKNLIKDKFFLMLLPDDLIIKKNCSKSMIQLNKKYHSSVMASLKVKKSDVTRWGIYKFKKRIDKKNFFIDDVIEKPSLKKAPSNRAVIGRYVLPKKIFSKLVRQKPGKGGEIHITDAIQSLIYDNEKFIAHNFSGKYLDCGSMKGYINSSKEISKL